jgi:fimbrial chaperone protein
MRKSIAWLLLSCILTNGWANGIKVSPIRIELSGESRIAVLKVSNPSDKPLLVQADLMRWTQKNGDDFYQKSGDVLVVPPLFSVPPHREQVMRLALSRPPENTELTYRLYLKEIVAQEVKKVPSRGLQMALRIGIPIFVAPRTEPRQEFYWKIKTMPGKGVVATLRNIGNTTIFIDKNQLLNQRGKPLIAEIPGFKYVLPGQEFQWVFPIKNSKYENNYKIKARINGNEILSETKQL